MSNVLIPGGDVMAGSGGYLQLWNWTGVSQITGASPTPINYRFLDVAHWLVQRKYYAPPLWYSGCHGSMRRRIVAADWSIFIRLWWSYKKPPDLLLTMMGDGLACKLTISDDSNWTGNLLSRFQNPNLVANPGTVNPSPATRNVNTGYGLLDAGDNYIPCYAAPLCVHTGQSIFDSSEPDDDGIIYHDILLENDSLLWYIPTQAIQAAYTGYVSDMARQGFIPNNV